MGLFDKRSKEEKEFWKVFKSAYTSPSDKTFAALETAYQSHSVPWQGYFLMGLCYDCAAGVAYNPEKAQEMHYQAQSRAGEEQKWVERFYTYYRYPAVNYKVELQPRTLAVRRTGVAAINSYEYRDAVILGEYNKDDCHFWGKIFEKVDTGGFFHPTDEQMEVFTERESWKQLFSDWVYFSSKGGNLKDPDVYREVKRRTNDLVKTCNKIQKRWKKETDIGAGEMYHYISAYYCLNEGPYTLFEQEELTGRSLPYLAISDYRSLAFRKVAPAIHKLARLLFASEDNYQFMVKAFPDIVHEVKILLFSGISSGDEEAARLYEMYYADNQEQSNE